MASSTRDKRLKRIQELLDGIKAPPTADLPEDPVHQVRIGQAVLCASAATWSVGCISRLQARTQCVDHFSRIDRTLWPQAFDGARNGLESTTPAARLAQRRRNLEDLINAVAASQPRTQ